MIKYFHSARISRRGKRDGQSARDFIAQRGTDHKRTRVTRAHALD